MASNFLQSIKWTRRLPPFLAAAGAYVSSSLILGRVTRDDKKRSAVLAKNLTRTCRRSQKVLGFTVDFDESQQSVDPKKNYLIVCNHLSYTDILAMASVMPCVFVTSVEVQHSFFLGFMSALGGSMFIERRNRANIDNEIAMIAQALRDGLNVVIFPEGTSSNGEGVLPFKRSLLKAAIDAQVDVLPLCLKYTEINGKPITVAESEPMAYYGKKDFFPHLQYVFGLDSYKVKIQALPVIRVRDVIDRKDIAERAYDSIAKAYGGKIHSMSDAEIDRIKTLKEAGRTSSL
jgi:1-acyl-sn-glycerol-3-phosphate acyltransferase